MTATKSFWRRPRRSEHSRSGETMLKGPLIVLLLTLITLLPATSARADDGTIEIISTSVVSEFPEGIRFSLEAKSDKEIETVAVRFKIGQQTAGAYNYLDFEQGTLIDSELFWRTNTSVRYIPPGTVIRYSFEVEDVDGGFLKTAQEVFTYHDARFTWEEISDGPVTVAYHGPVKSRAQTILETIVETFSIMGPLLGADIEAPLRVTVYNNVKEMLQALPPRSATISRELITEGQAFTNVGTLLILGSSRLYVGTSAHEAVHILTHRAGDSTFRRVPSWLDEGLAEFGNPEPGYSYDIALDFALETDRLMPITFMETTPGDPEDVIIFYGEARSIVRFMVFQYGPFAMRDLIADLKSGTNMDDALEKLYGVDRIGLENLWREAIYAPLYEPPDLEAARPTAVPRPTVLPYTLTPQPQAEAIGGTGPTPEPEQQATETPTREPEPTATSAPVTAARDTAEPTATTVVQPKAPEDEPEGGGGGCSARPGGAPGAGEVSTAVLLVGLVGLAVRRRVGRPRG